MGTERVEEGVVLVRIAPLRFLREITPPKVAFHQASPVEGAADALGV